MNEIPVCGEAGRRWKWDSRFGSMIKIVIHKAMIVHVPLHVEEAA
jgi:hypothetical protein